MNSKAQASSEYLMAYVWIVIILVTLASVFFVVLNKNFSCSSSDPKIIIESYSLPYSKNYASSACPEGSCEAWGETFEGDSSGKMVLRNATGGEMSIIGIGPFSRSYSLEKTPNCVYAQLFVPNYFNGKNYNLINGGQEIKTASGGQIFINNLSLNHDALSRNCKVTDFSYPEKYYFSIVYRNNALEEKTMQITCEGFPEKN